MIEGLSPKQMRKFLVDIVGEEGVQILDVCKKGCTDEEICKRTGFKLSNIRSVLNQLHYIGVIKYSREKDEATHWYTYTWFLKKDKISELLKERWEEELKVLEGKVTYEENYVFFACNNGCERLPFELAAEYDFKCPECGKELKEFDNGERIKDLKKELKDIRGLLKKL
jgi:transcription initiation factor TFIIE subunit alpha